MRPPPSVSRFYVFPVVSMTAIVAMFVTAAVLFGKTEVDPFTMNSLAFEGEPWRLAASALPHGNLLHLLFNVYWLWILGSRLEEELGHVSTLLIMIVLAVGSAAAQYAFSGAGIGLSGVGYGIVGYLAAARRVDPRFRDAIDTRTLQVFLVWGLLCIVLTMTNVMAVANWAHGVGFLLGIPLAYAYAPGAMSRRGLSALGALALTASFTMLAWQWRGTVNLSSSAGDDDAYLGTKEIDAKQYDRAIRHLERAIDLSPKDGNAWYNYGVALQYAPSTRGITKLDAWKKALALEPKNESAKRAVARELVRQGLEAFERGDTATAESLYRESLSIQETGAATWHLGEILEEKDDHEGAAKLFERAHQLDPDLPAPAKEGAPAPAAGSAVEVIESTGSAKN
jgi:GlpG protein